MAEETRDSKISLLQSKNNPNNLILKIPNYFTLPEYANASFDMKSDSFQFANATWCFQLESSDRRISQDRNIITEFLVKIIRLNFEESKQKLYYIILLLDGNNEEYQRLYDKDIFDEVINERVMIHAKNDKPLYDNRDTLTLVINLFHLDLTEEGTEQLTSPTDRSLEILSQDFKKLFQSGENHDLTLRVADTEFPVHQGVLVARSPVFKAMLSHDMSEKNKGLIDILDSHPQDMEQLLLYMYSGKVETNNDNVFGIYYLADKYGIPHLKEKCSEFLKSSLSESVIYDVIQLAINHSDTGLLEHATEYVLNHDSEILSSPEFTLFLSSNLDAGIELITKAFDKWFSEIF